MVTHSLLEIILFRMADGWLVGGDSNDNATQPGWGLGWAELGKKEAITNTMALQVDDKSSLTPALTWVSCFV